MPAEWEPHEASWIGWPVNPDDWPGKLDAVRWAFVEIARHLSKAERVHILVPTQAVERDATKRLQMAGVDPRMISFHCLKTNRNWLRDAGAIFVADRATGKMNALQFKFNAWAKYDNWRLDRAIPELMSRIAHCPLEKGTIQSERKKDWMTLEGGAIEVNGAGLLMTTEECLLSDVQARNPGHSKQEVEHALKSNFGCERIIWLQHGIEGDDTHGHIDDLARFVAERTVVAVEEKNPRHPNHRPLRENLEILKSFRDEKGSLEIVLLPMPETIVFDGMTLPASYANFYIANETVLVPTFNDPADRVALGIIQDVFPSRVVRGISAVDLIWGLGTLHCLTQQQPAKFVRSPSKKRPT